MTARRSLSVWPVDGGCTRANISGAAGSSGQLVEELAHDLARLHALASGERRARLLEVDDHRVGARRDGAARGVARRARPRTAPTAAGAAASRFHQPHLLDPAATASAAPPRTTVPSKNPGFGPACSRTGLTNVSSRKSRSGDHAALDELVRLGDRLGHVGDVPVRDVGAEHRAQPRAERVHVVAERPRDAAGRRPRTRSRSWARTASRRSSARVDLARRRTRRAAPAAPPGRPKYSRRSSRLRRHRRRRRTRRSTAAARRRRGGRGRARRSRRGCASPSGRRGPANSAHAHATPPSRNPMRSSGNRRVTPPRNSDLHSDSCAAAARRCGCRRSSRSTG